MFWKEDNKYQIKDSAGISVLGQYFLIICWSPVEY